MTDIKVKGAVLRGFLREIKETSHGGIARFLELVPGDRRDRLFAERFLHVGWYPYEILEVLLETYFNQVARGNRSALFDLGIRSAQRDLGSAFQVLSWLTKPHVVGERSETIWQQKYNRGEMKLVESWDDGFRLELRGFPEIHRLNCEMVCGYMQGFGVRWRKEFRASHDRCVHRGAGLCSFVGQW